MKERTGITDSWFVGIKYHIFPNTDIIPEKIRDYVESNYDLWEQAEKVLDFHCYTFEADDDGGWYIVLEESDPDVCNNRMDTIRREVDNVFAAGAEQAQKDYDTDNPAKEGWHPSRVPESNVPTGTVRDDVWNTANHQPKPLTEAERNWDSGQPIDPHKYQSKTEGAVFACHRCRNDADKCICVDKECWIHKDQLEHFTPKNEWCIDCSNYKDQCVCPLPSDNGLPRYRCIQCEIVTGQVQDGLCRSCYETKNEDFSECGECGGDVDQCDCQLLEDHKCEGCGGMTDHKHDELCEDCMNQQEVANQSAPDNKVNNVNNINIADAADIWSTLK